MTDKKPTEALYDDAKLTPDNPEALSPEDRTAKEMAERHELETEVQTTIFDGIREDNDRPVQPVKLTNEDIFQFSCHKGVSCWNVCCHGADVTLTPFDILTLAKHFGVRPKQFIADYTVPAIHEASNLPVPKLVMTGKEGEGPCVFMDDDIGCTVYENRPVTNIRSPDHDF